MKNFILCMMAGLLLLSAVKGQGPGLSGQVIDTQGNPLPYATVALLSPADSTVSNVCLTGSQGRFELNRVPQGKQILQVSFVGFKTFYKTLNLPLASGSDLGYLMLGPDPRRIDAVEITAERIPMQFRDDTVEYNAGAFKTIPGAVAEDLLRKLPGLEVDRTGNIKAMGENVTKVTVDGKEFFSPDPKIATKNLPSESIKKVQVYDRKSDESELLGLEDSDYDKTINFVLKEDAKKAIFGDIQAGAALADYFQGRGKLFRFTNLHQVAVLAMANNVNRPGFSFNDYLDFNGGLRNAMSGSTIEINTGDDNSMPVDFGRPVSGKLTSGAGGFNYSFEPVKNNRYNFSYMGNTSRNDVFKNVISRQLTGNDFFEQHSTETAKGFDQNHLLNLGWRNKSGKRQHFMLNGILAFRNDHARSDLLSESLNGALTVNQLENREDNLQNRVNATLETSWLVKGNDRWKMFKVSATARHTQRLQQHNWNSVAAVIGDSDPVESAGRYVERNRKTLYEGKLTTLYNLGNGFYLEPSAAAGFTRELLNRDQENQLEPFTRIDSLSPELTQHILWINPGLYLKKYGKKLTFSAGSSYQAGSQFNIRNDSMRNTLKVSSMLPRASVEYAIRAGRRVTLEIFSSLTLPSPYQLLPVISTSNPYAILYGNPGLRPQKRHTLALTWFLYDQFSFTSLFAGIDGSIIRNKFSSSVVIDDQLRQSTTLINVPAGNSISAFADFSTPIRPLGLNIGIGFRESFNKSPGYVNGQNNTLTSVDQRFELKFDNRKKEVWDVEIGGKLGLSRAHYSLMKELNTRYYNTSLFGEVRWTPTVKWHFRVTADLTRYNASELGQSVQIPLLSAEIGFYFKADKASSLFLEGSDLLNRNTGYSRFTENNTFQEVHSSVIGRFLMLSYRYRFKP